MTQASIKQSKTVQRNFWLLIAANFAAFVTVGCISPTPPGELPTGCWSGEGTFVYETWPAPSTQPSKPSEPPQSLCREYKTTLCIKPGKLDGRDVLDLYIRSAHGSFPDNKDMGEETFIRAALVKAKRMSDSAFLYRAIALQINPGPNARLQVDEKAPPFTASCMTDDGQTVFQIHYMDNFVDVFRFEGSRVEKTGVFFNTESGLIHWVESLKPSRKSACPRCCPELSPVAPKP